MTTTTSEVGLRKVKRIGTKKIYAVRVLPPDFKMDEEGGGDTQFFFYYVSRNYKPVSSECTKHVWKRAEGQAGPGVVRNGFDTLSSSRDFLLHEKDGKIIAVDILPSNAYTSKTSAPAVLHDLQHIEVIINVSTGEVEFVAVPVGVSKQQLQQLIGELDKVDMIQAGDTLGGAFYVHELQGNRVKISPPSRGSAGRVTQMD
jgi:hypothetical protein